MLVLGAGRRQDRALRHAERNGLGGPGGTAADLQRWLVDAGLEEVAQYAVPMAFRIRFVMQMTAREAMHLTELRSQPQGHPTYRRVAQRMHRLISEVHPSIGGAFGYVSHEDVDLERLEAERRTEAKRSSGHRG
jgi:thymidylate synthase ThyX